jgi:hypothetical protein
MKRKPPAERGFRRSRGQGAWPEYGLNARDSPSSGSGEALFIWAELLLGDAVATPVVDRLLPERHSKPERLRKGGGGYRSPAMRALQETRWLARLLLVVLTTLVVFVALSLAWVSLVVATGGGGDECGGGSCGTLGDWDYANGEYVFFGALALALFSGVLFARRFDWSRKDARR